MKVFKSIKWKVATMFTLIVVFIWTLVCTVHLTSMIYSGKQDFEKTVSDIFSQEFISELAQMAENVNYTVDSNPQSQITLSTNENDNIAAIYNKILIRSGDLGINSERFMCILNSDCIPIYCTSVDATNDGIEKNGTVISALNGNIGMSTSFWQMKMDYAFPLSTTRYVVYIMDSGEKLYNNAKNVLYLYIKCLVFALILSFLGGMYLANSITIPLKSLNEWAKGSTEENLSKKAAIDGNDELSELATVLSNMAHNLDMKNTEARNEKTKLETIIQNMTDGILAFDTQGKLIHYNLEAKKLINREFFDDLEFDKFFKEIKADITIGDLLYMKPDGDIERSVEIEGGKFVLMNFAIFNLDEKPGGIVVVLHDTTKQEMLEKGRRAFVADVSHELRTPITTIKSYAETLSENPNAEKELMTRFLGVIASEADRMARLISDLLTLSALDDKSTPYKIPEPIDVRKALSNVIERLQMSAKKKNITLTYNPINEVPIIDGDIDSLVRIFINIIGNAIKYTPENGNVVVYSSKVYNDICIKVVDDGIGIPEENLPHIFDRFYRVDKARSRDTGGTGLGLAIAKQTVENGFGGKIKITSELNKGTEVLITIPTSA